MLQLMSDMPLIAQVYISKDLVDNLGVFKNINGFVLNEIICASFHPLDSIWL